MYGKQSWGRYPKVEQSPIHLDWKSDIRLNNKEESFLPFGQGRSYGDVCLNEGDHVLTTKNLNNFICFDVDSGLLRAQAGVTLRDILEVIVPKGWFIPVSPGTQFVSLGGAIANDIHGKNHHKAGTFGRYVTKMLVRRSDNETILCSPQENHLFFNATVAGLGLTGLIEWAEIQLIPIVSSQIDCENIKFGSLDEFFEISKESEKDYDYTVAWLDCVSKGNSFGRGIFMRGNHSQSSSVKLASKPKFFQPIMPCDLPNWTLNRYSVKAFNYLYYHKQFEKFKRFESHYEPFFYPLDSILHWNRIYGARGFVQFQCVIGPKNSREALNNLLRTTVDSGQASFLAVLKQFGDLPSPGLLSFPKAGSTICLDFPYRGKVTDSLLADLEAITMESGGSLYPAKDAKMTPDSFRKCFPNLEEFMKFKDPNASSSFWRRVTGESS